MTDSENSQPQNDSDDDIYKDIPEFNFEDELAKLEGSKETYKQEANDLSEKVKILTDENKELKKSNEVLKKNLSTLLKTAQAEVKRKDSLIQELRTQVDSFTFRRNKTVTKDKYTNTDDFEFQTKVKCEPEKHKCVSDVKRSKSYENRTSSESERRLNLDEEKWKDSSTGKEENANCDINRNSGHHRRNSKTNFKHSDSGHERHRDKKSSRYEDSSDYRRSYRENHRAHLKSDSFEKKRHSRSSDSRFLSRRRYSRERRSDRRRRDSSERRRSDESSERSRRRKERSRSREISRGSKEPSLEKPKTRSSLDKESIVRNKEPVSNKSEVTDGGRASDGGDGKKPRVENTEKRTVQDVVRKNRQNKDKRMQKKEKQSGLDVFSTKSPLDALYNEMVISRSSNRFSSSKPGTTQPESDVEEGELSASRNSQADTSESQPEEDWTLSFKNERQNNPKPMTLYSRRMMRKFSSETKQTENAKKKEETDKPVDVKKSEKIQEMEKEPGELTDDENIVESSKEFQELAKVASIEIELDQKSMNEKTFKEPVRKDSSSKLENMKTAPTEAPQKEVEKPNSGKEDPSANKEVEQNKEIREVIEFSPFKNNYKLIEISPIKPPENEHVLDFYNQRPPSGQPTERPPLDSSETITESEKSKQSDTSEEKTSEAELKIVIPPAGETNKEKESTSEGKEVKESRKRKEKAEEKRSKDSKKDDLGRGKRRPASKKDIDKPASDDKSQKRKRKCSETEEGNSDAKKRKLEKSEPSRKSSRSKSNSKSEPEQAKHEEPKLDQSQPEPEPVNKIKEDILSFEFFKPAAKDVPQTPVDPNKSVRTATDYKMTATMSVTGVVRLETPDKCMEKLKNLMINEHMIFNVLDSKTNSQFSPLIGSKCIEMTPRRMLKNDLMLTDSEDDSVLRDTTKRDATKGEEEEVEDEEAGGEEEEEEEEIEGEISGSENSECDSDSGASDFVDML